MNHVRGEAKPKVSSNCFDFTLVVHARSPSVGNYPHETSILPDTHESVSRVFRSPTYVRMYDCCCYQCGMMWHRTYIPRVYVPQVHAVMFGSTALYDMYTYLPGHVVYVSNAANRSVINASNQTLTSTHAGISVVSVHRTRQRLFFFPSFLVQ